MKEILLLNTGGTIASSATEKGLAPKYGVEDFFNKVPEIQEFCNVNGKNIMSIDSSNMQPEDWIEIAESVYKNYENYDGFVITHGTDTMAYTSSALSYIIENLNKPVVLTGGQDSIEKPTGDARKNITDSFRFACEPVHGVFVVFNGKVIRGTSASKVRSKSYDAFESINRPIVAQIKEDQINYIQQTKDMRGKEGVKINTDLCPDVFLLKLIPGTKPELMQKLKKYYKGVVIESFGAGCLPFRKRDLLAEAEKLINSGVAVVITTQCLEEGTDLSVYEVGRKTSKLNIIDGRDMTTEALVTKLMCALGRSNDLNQVKEFVQTPIA